MESGWETVIMKGCMWWNTNYDWRVSNTGHQQASAKSTELTWLLSFRMKLSKIYSTVEKKIGNIFARYGRFIARHPIKVIALVVIINGGLGVGMVKLQQETATDDVYIPQGMKYELVVLFCSVPWQKQLVKLTNDESFCLQKRMLDKTD